MFRRVALNPVIAVTGLLAVALGLAAFAAPRAACGALYVVERYDTLSGIAQRCRSSVAAIAAASGVRNPDFIRIGQQLVIPGRVAAARSAPPPRQAPAEAGGYRFERGDTLFSLARWSRVSLPALMAVNPGIDPRKIEIGDPVRLPAGASDPAFVRQRERGGQRPARIEPPRGGPAEDRPNGRDEPEPEPEGM